MATDEFDRATLIAAYRVAHGAPPSRSERVLTRLRAPSDYAVLLPDPHPHAVWPMIVLAIAAAVLAVFALEAMTGELAARLGRAERFEAVDRAERVRESAVAGTGQPYTGLVRTPTIAAAPAELPATLPPLPAPVPVQTPVAAPIVPLQKPVALAQPSRPRVVAPVQEPVAAPAPEPDRESALLETARLAIGRRAWVDAGTALGRHRGEFPQGMLAPERDALQLVVDCRSNPGEETRARARDFIVHQARSPHIKRVQAACRGGGPKVISPFD